MTSAPSGRGSVPTASRRLLARVRDVMAGPGSAPDLGGEFSGLGGGLFLFRRSRLFGGPNL